MHQPYQVWLPMSGAEVNSLVLMYVFGEREDITEGTQNEKTVQNTRAKHRINDVWPL